MQLPVLLLNLTICMPRHSAAGAVHSVKGACRHWLPLRSHYSNQCRHASLQCELDLRVVLVFGRHRKHSHVEGVQVGAKAGHSTSHVKHHSDATAPRELRDILQGIKLHVYEHDSIQHLE